MTEKLEDVDRLPPNPNFGEGGGSENVTDERSKEALRLISLVLSRFDAQGWLPASGASNVQEDARSLIARVVAQTIDVLLDEGSVAPSSLTALSDSELELAAITALRRRLDGFGYMKSRKDAAWKDFNPSALQRAAATGQPFEDDTENFAFFFQLSIFLTSTERDQLLHHTASEWVALRRMFLALCDRPVPRDLKAKPFHNLLGETVMTDLTGDGAWQREYVPHLLRIKQAVRRHLHLSERLNLECIRKQLVEGSKVDLGPDSGPYSDICEAFYLMEDAFEDSSSVEGTIMRYYRDHGQPVINKSHERAVRSGRGVRFDLIVESLRAEGAVFGEDYRGLPDLLTRFTGDRSILLSSRVLQDYFIDGIVFEGTEFLKDIQRTLRKGEKRPGSGADGRITMFLARNWTNPHCPLWLMENKAIAHAYSAFFGLPTQEGSIDALTKSLRDRIKHVGLFRTQLHPIVGVESDNKTKAISKFVIAKTIYPELFKEPFNVAVADLYAARTGQKWLCLPATGYSLAKRDEKRHRA